MNLKTYPLGIALKNGGGRKVKQDRHIRSARQRRKAFKAESEKVIQKFERMHGISVNPEIFLELTMTNPHLAQLGRQLVMLRHKFLGA